MFNVLNRCEEFLCAVCHITPMLKCINHYSHKRNYRTGVFIALFQHKLCLCGENWLFPGFHFTGCN